MFVSVMTKYSYCNSCFFKKKTAAIEKTMRLHDADLEHSLVRVKKIDAHMFFFPFL